MVELIILSDYFFHLIWLHIFYFKFIFNFGSTCQTSLIFQLLQDGLKIPIPIRMKFEWQITGAKGSPFHQKSPPKRFQFHQKFRSLVKLGAFWWSFLVRQGALRTSAWWHMGYTYAKFGYSRNLFLSIWVFFLSCFLKSFIKISHSISAVAIALVFCLAWKKIIDDYFSWFQTSFSY